MDHVNHLNSEEANDSIIHLQNKVTNKILKIFYFFFCQLLNFHIQNSQPKRSENPAETISRHKATL